MPGHNDSANLSLIETDDGILISVMKIMSGITLTTSVILGNDFMVKHNVVINYSTKQISFPENLFRLFGKLQNGVKTSSSFKLEYLNKFQSLVDSYKSKFAS